MFVYRNYRILETKEEYLKDYSKSWNRYDGGEPPFSIEKLDTKTFPIGLHYCASDDPYFCGSWWSYPAEEIKEKLMQSYQEEIDYYKCKQEQLKELFSQQKNPYTDKAIRIFGFEDPRTITIATLEEQGNTELAEKLFKTLTEEEQEI